MSNIGRIVLAIALPAMALLGGGWIMIRVSAHHDVTTRIRESGIANPKPLNRRVWGYDRAAAAVYWGALDEDARAKERRFLELDLIFPFLYGGALAAGLLILWAGLGRNFSPAWLLGPVILACIADWIENLAQLHQFDHSISPNGIELQDGWIRVASTATTVKMLALYLTTLLLFGLVIRLVFRR